MPTYFAGNILPPESERTSEDHTFRFSKEEANGLQLVGKPIRLEHERDLTCGKVVKQMKDRRGKIYVVGRIDDDDMKTKDKKAVRVFAGKALGGLYNSLSLQHVHEEDMDGSNRKKTAVEVSLVNVPRRPNCDIQSIRRHSVRHAASGKTATENEDYIGTTAGTNAHTLKTVPHSSTASSDMASTPETSSAPAETQNQSAPAATEKKQESAPKAESANAPPAASKKEGDIVMQDVINVVVEQESELEIMRKKLAEVEAANAKYTAEKEERERTESEAKEKKRKAAQDRANALLETVTQLWDSQVDDALWADEESRKQQKENFKKMIETQPEISRDILKIAHCASARYAEVMNSDAQRQRDLTSRLGHVMKKRKTVHAASARSVEHGESAPAAAASSSSSGASSSAPQKKTLMEIMKGYGGSGGVSGTATSIMQRLYKSHMDRQAPF